MSYVEQLREIRIITVGEQKTVARHEADEKFKLLFDRIQIFKNISVIELEIVDDRDFGQVMNELAALVEKRGVIFVAFDDEPFAVGEARALAEIVRNAPDEIARIQTVVFKNP